MASGSYREIIEIHRPDTTQNEYGEVQQDAWVMFATTRAGYEPLTGREMMAVEHAASQIDVRFRMRYRTGIKPNFRIFYRGGYYQVIFEPIDVDGRHKELLLYCKKVS